MTRFSIITIAPFQYAHFRAFDEIKILLYASLTELGHEVTLRTNSFDQSCTNIILGAHLLREESFSEIPVDSILFNTEQLGGDFCEWTEKVAHLAVSHRIWDYSTHNLSSLIRIIPSLDPQRAKRIRLGFHPSLRRISHSSRSGESGFAFFGSVTQQRQAILNNIRISDRLLLDVYFGFYGFRRDAILACSRAALNIHSHPVRILEWTRVLYLIANQIPVIALLHPSTYAEDDQLSYVLPCLEENPTPQLESYYATPELLVSHAQDAYIRISEVKQEHYTAQALDELLASGFAPSPSTLPVSVDHQWRFSQMQRSPDPLWYRYTYSWLEADPRPLQQVHWEVGVFRQYHPDPNFAAEVFRPPLSLSTIAEDQENPQADAGMILPRCAVVLHFFSELRVCPFFINFGRHFPADTHFFVTASSRIVKALVQRLAADCGIASIEILLVENVGRDIPSKYILFNESLLAFDLCFFSHGKESDDHWFFDHNYLLAGSPERIKAIQRLFATDAQLGLLYPDYLAHLLPSIGWSDTRSMVDQLLMNFGCDTSAVELLEFPAGGFFWARPEALTLLHSLGLTIENLPPEPIGRDNTLLHALERMPCLSTEMMGMRWEKLGRTNPLIASMHE